MARDAEAHAAEDAKKKEEIEVRNNADSLTYSVERILREQGDKVPADLKQQIDGKVAALRSALQGSDISYIRNTTSELSDLMQKIGSAVYQQQEGPTPPPPGGEPPPPPDNGGQQGGEEGTVEGEFREV
jgi:molecular chaperone DnaK